MRAGEGDYRPTGNRTLWLPELDLPDDVWAGFQIPIGLAFFMESTVTDCIVAMYPSPAGATEIRAPLRVVGADASSATRCSPTSSRTSRG